MKRRSFFARVFGLAAASAVAPEAVKPAPLVEFGDMITLTPVKYASFDLQTGQWSEHIYVQRGIIKNGLKYTQPATPLDGSRE